MLTVLVGFGAGFALAGPRGGSPSEPVAAGSGSTTTSTSAAPKPTSSELASTTPPTTTTIDSSTTTSPAPTITAAPTTVATTAAPTTAVAPVPTTAPRPTLPPTSRPVPPAPPTTFAPPKVSVTFAADANGRLVVPRVGSATMVLTNTGGLASQWLLTGTGFATTGGPTQGTIGPGQSVLIAITAPPGELSKAAIPGIISILGATNSNVAFVIPAA